MFSKVNADLFRLPEHNCKTVDAAITKILSESEIEASDLLYLNKGDADRFLAALREPEKYRISFHVPGEEAARVGIVTKVSASNTGRLEVHYDNKIYRQPEAPDSKFTDLKNLSDLKIYEVKLLEVNKNPTLSDFKYHQAGDLFLKAKDSPESYRISFVDPEQEVSSWTSPGNRPLVIGKIKKLYSVDGMVEVHFDGGNIFRAKYQMDDPKLLTVKSDPRLEEFTTFGHADYFIMANDNPKKYRISFKDPNQKGSSTDWRRTIGKVTKLYAVNGKIEAHFDDGSVFNQRYYMDDVKLLTVIENPKLEDFRYSAPVDIYNSIKSHPPGHYKVSFLIPRTEKTMTGKVRRLTA